MQALNLPKTDLQITRKGDKLQVYDLLRRKTVALTPEEWVRQHFVRWLIQQKGYPAALMNNEVSIQQGGTRKRCDTVVYSREALPLMIIEYKAPTVEITQRVFDQITRYNMQLHVRWLIVSNGLQHYCCQIDYEKREYHFVNDIPLYQEL